MAARSRRIHLRPRELHRQQGMVSYGNRMTEALLAILVYFRVNTRSNGQRCDIAGIRIIDGVGVMLADRTKFSGNPPTGPKQLDAMASAAFWTNAFR